MSTAALALADLPFALGLCALFADPLHRVDVALPGALALASRPAPQGFGRS